MKQVDILKVLGQELGTGDMAELNKLFKTKAEQGPKFRMMGKKVGHLGVTGPIKALTNEGLKVYTTGRVVLVRFADIETFTKAVPRAQKVVVRPKITIDDPEVLAVKKKLDNWRDSEDREDDIDDDDWVEEKPKAKPKKKKVAEAKKPVNGSIYFEGQRRSKK